MKLRTSISLVVFGCLAASAALADCAADSTVPEVRQRYAKGQQLEREGNITSAFDSYVAAQDYTCDPNPVEAAAAQRAAPLALQLGAAAEKNGKLDKAFDIYERGGQYMAADRALMGWVRKSPDDPTVFTKARETLEYHASPAFQANNKVRIGVTGAYRSNPQHLTEVLGMPQRGFDRALQKETEAFSEEYLRAVVQREQSRPDDVTDTATIQAWAARQQAAAQKWSKYPDGDPIKASRASLALARTWAFATADQTLSEKLQSQLGQRQQLRATTLMKSFSESPTLLDEAIDYQMNVTTLDDAARKSRADEIRALAGRLGDAANGKQRYGLAADYYGVAGQDSKQQAAQEAMRTAAMAKMQPTIDQMQQQAQRMQQEFSDPAKVQAMREQALAIQKAMQEQQKANAGSNAQKADDLESELGM